MKQVYLLIFAVVAFVIGECISIYSPQRLDANMIPELQEAIIAQEASMSEMLDKMNAAIVIESRDTTQKIISDMTPAGYEVYYFQDRKLTAWSGAELYRPSLQFLQEQPRVFYTENGEYLKVYRKCPGMGNYLFALLKLKRHYPYNNDYLHSEWNHFFDVHKDVKIVLHAKNNHDLPQIHDANGAYLFSLDTSESENIEAISYLTYAKTFTVIIWALIMLYLIYWTANWIFKNKNGTYAIIATVIMCILGYIWALHIHMAKYMMEISIFSPQVFAYDWWIPSLGYMLIATGLWFMAVILSIRFIYISHIQARVPKLNDPRWLYGVLLVAVFGVFMFVNVCLNMLIYHSSDLLLYIDDIDISFTSIVKITIITLLWLSYILYLDGLYYALAKKLSIRDFVLIIGVFSLVVTIPMDIFMDDFGHLLTVGFLSTNIIFFKFKREREIGIKFSSYVWLMFASALILTIRILMLNEVKELNNRKLLMSNLTFELMRDDDPVAEYLLNDISDSLAVDNTLVNIMTRSKEGPSETEVYAYLRERYFDEYFSRYDLQVIPCMGPQSTIQLTSNSHDYNCYDYFQEMLDTYGVRINKKSIFYCLNDNDGRASYFGIIKIISPWNQEEKRLFVELNALPNTLEVGYPELLINSRDKMDSKRLKGYSYAKYYKGNLYNHYGTFEYPHTFVRPPSLAKDVHFYTFDYNGQNHWVQQTQENQYVALSYPQLTIRNMFADYSFLFLCLLMGCTLILYALRYEVKIIYVNMSMHERMQSTLIIMSLVTFVMFCIITGWQSIERNEKRSRDHMSTALRGMRSVLSTELEERDYTFHTEDTRILIDNMMQRLATLFSLDAHFYDPDGRLLGTSRSELFMSKMKSNLIDGNALSALRYDLSEEVFQQENIGEMVYYSIYAPVISSNGTTLGYVNIPYFEDVKGRKREIISTLLPMTNLYMLIIIISILVSYFLASTISKPLKKISSSLRLVGLEKRNEKLEYPNSDEIGQLVDEYNRMIDELEKSAQKLAATERESTWRNMARQIAHEIKNPLTPMKLSVQYLLKSWDEGRADFDTFIHRVGKTLVEQIDQLSYIATQFSSLAKTPNGEPEIVDVVEKLETCVYLFQREPDVDISLEKTVENAKTFINPEQLMSVFNNIVKNAQQAKKPDDEIIKIEAKVEIVDENVLVKIKDYGKGIPEDVQDNIFKPNFTTKSTGMGLGLAIVNNIILNAQGSISFESKVGEGTTFSIKLPNRNN